MPYDGPQSHEPRSYEHQGMLKPRFAALGGEAKEGVANNNYTILFRVKARVEFYEITDYD